MNNLRTTRHPWRVALPTVLALSTTLPAFGADDIMISRPHSSSANLYLGGSIGNARYSELDDNSASFSLFGGYNVNEILSVEGNWSSLGEAENNGATADVSALSLSILGKLPLKTDLTLFGRAGLARWNFDFKSSALDDSDSDTDPYFGLGLDYNITGNTSVRFDWNRYSMEPTLGGVRQDQEDISNFSVGIIFRP
jgi:OOP family OmpA-OmpF porin